MFRNIFSVFFVFISSLTFSQLQFSGQQTDLGTIEAAYQIAGDVVISNSSEEKIFLMRADAPDGVKVFTSKKTLYPGDTALLIISFLPRTSGKFEKEIKLVSSDQEKPYRISITGKVNRVLSDDKTACFYFGSRSRSNVKIKEGVVYETPAHVPRDNSNRIPDQSSEPLVTKKIIPAIPKKKLPDTSDFSADVYKPNNVVFLIDVSNSMKDSLKLPLLKNSIYKLINSARAIDKITVLSYSDSLKILAEAVPGTNKEELKKIVASLKARGLTKGNKAILKSQLIAQKHLIAGGNNQILLATDGEFKFYEKDYTQWKSNQLNGKIVLSTLAFGDDKTAMKNLKDIAQKCDGTSIHIKNRVESESKLMDEIKIRSKR